MGVGEGFRLEGVGARSLVCVPGFLQRFYKVLGETDLGQHFKNQTDLEKQYLFFSFFKNISLFYVWTVWHVGSYFLES